MSFTIQRTKNSVTVCEKIVEAVKQSSRCDKRLHDYQTREITAIHRFITTGCPRNNLRKRKLFFSTNTWSNRTIGFYLTEQFSKFLFQMIIMQHSLETKIQVVVLMAKFESPEVVIRELQRQEATEIPESHIITAIYQKFRKTGSVQDVSPPGRITVIDEDKVNEVEQALTTEPINTVSNIGRETSISKSQAHRTMCDIIKFKPYMIYSTQHLYDEDIDLRVEIRMRPDHPSPYFSPDPDP